MALSRRKYLKTECISFKSTKGEYGGLSNMAPNYPIYINKISVNNVELLYQALRYPDHPDIQNGILQHKSPMSAKKYSRQYIKFTRPDWDSQRFKIMKFCIQLKYFYNKKTFGKLLLSTKNKPIVEFTYEDKVWGVTDEGIYYEGTNALGRLLMELREDIIRDEFTLIIPSVEKLTLLGIQINFESIDINSF